METDNETPFEFSAYKIIFPSDFKCHALHAAEYVRFQVPAPVAIPNAELAAGEAYGQEDEAVDIRYPEALNQGF